MPRREPRQREAATATATLITTDVLDVAAVQETLEEQPFTDEAVERWKAATESAPTKKTTPSRHASHQTSESIQVLVPWRPAPHPRRGKAPLKTE